MDIKSVFQNAKNLTDYQIEQHFDELLRKQPSFRHLNEANQSLILELVHKYKDKIRKGIRVSGYTIREDSYHLYQNRLKLNLTHQDLETIKDILESFKTE